MKLIFLTLALVLFLVAAVLPPPGYEAYRTRLLAAGLAFLVAASYPFP